MLSDFEKHSIAYRKAYDRFPALPHEQRVLWAEKVANTVGLQVAYSTSGPLLTGKYEPADYLDDTFTKKGPVE